MAGQEFRLLARRLGKVLLQCRRYAPMQRLALRSEQALVGGIPHQGVLEGVDDLRRRTAAEDQFRGEKPVERGVELAWRGRPHGREQRIGELPPDAGGDLRRLLHPAHAVEPCQQRGLQRGGNRGPRIGRTRLDHGLGQLLDEQGHPIGPRGDLGHDLRRPGRCSPVRPVTMASVDAAAEAVEAQSRDVRMPVESGLGLGPAGEQDEHARGDDPVA